MLFTPSQWTLIGSARVDHFSNFDAQQFSSAAAPVQLPSFSETVFDPRVGLVRRLTPWLSLNASGFRAYRAPTENELYRTGQVAQQITNPNPNLRSERATGGRWIPGHFSKHGSSIRASYFWTQVNRPITALTLSVTPTSTLLQRENLGQIESRGVHRITPCSRHRGSTSRAATNLPRRRLQNLPRSRSWWATGFAGRAQHGDGTGAIHAPALRHPQPAGAHERPPV